MIVSMKKGLIHREERIGKVGKPFTLYKIRTMKGEKSTDPDVVRRRFVGIQTDADRTTLLGAFLRFFSFDEIPQFLNIFLGEMNIIGIRPLPQEEFDLLPDDIRTFYLRRGPGFMPTPPSWDKNDDINGKLIALRQLMHFIEESESLRSQGKTVEWLRHITSYLLARRIERLCDPLQSEVVRKKLKKLLPFF